VFGSVQVLEPVAKPTKFSTVFGALSLNNLILMVPRVVLIIASVPVVIFFLSFLAAFFAAGFFAGVAVLSVVVAPAVVPAAVSVVVLVVVVVVAAGGVASSAWANGAKLKAAKLKNASRAIDGVNFVVLLCIPLS
jgi:hypothetical protein